MLRSFIRRKNEYTLQMHTVIILRLKIENICQKKCVFFWNAFLSYVNFLLRIATKCFIFRESNTPPRCHCLCDVCVSVFVFTLAHKLRMSNIIVNSIPEQTNSHTNTIYLFQLCTVVPLSTTPWNVEQMYNKTKSGIEMSDYGSSIALCGQSIVAAVVVVVLVFRN